MTDGHALSDWQIGVWAVLLVLLMTAVASDMRQRRIPNVLVLAGLALGVLLHGFGAPSAGDGGIFSPQGGAIGAWRAIGGAATGLLLFLPLYLLRTLGAGDVKLMAAVGAFAGAAATVNLSLFVLLAGGVLALARMAVARNARLVMQNTLATLGQMLPGSVDTFDARSRTAWRMPYALAILGGVLAYGAWTLTGHAPIIAF